LCKTARPAIGSTWNGTARGMSFKWKPPRTSLVRGRHAARSCLTYPATLRGVRPRLRPAFTGSNSGEAEEEAQARVKKQSVPESGILSHPTLASGRRWQSEARSAKNAPESAMLPLTSFATASGLAHRCIKLLRFVRQGWVLIAFSQSNPEG
jgi:hypothetical protein